MIRGNETVMDGFTLESADRTGMLQDSDEIQSLTVCTGRLESGTVGLVVVK